MLLQAEHTRPKTNHIEKLEKRTESRLKQLLSKGLA